MGFWNALFGGTELTPEEQKQEEEAKRFDLLKFDGIRAYKMGQTDFAIRCLNEALKMHDDLETRDYLSQALITSSQLEPAYEELQHIAQAQPDNLAIYLRMAHVAYMLEDYERMAEVCSTAQTIDDSNALVYYLTAQAMMGQNDSVGAIAMLTKAIALQEDYADAYLLRSQTLLRMGDTATADQDAEWLIDHVGDHEDVLLLKARIEAAKGNADEAIGLYGKVIDMNPFSIEAFRERGQLRFDRGDKDGAGEDMQKVLELDPNQLANVNGDYSAEGIEQHVRQAYSAVNPLGL